VLGNNLDFTGFVPISGSSSNGYLSISSETTPAECAILSVSLNNSTATWITTDGGKVDFPTSELGAVSRFCSGTVTRRNTVMVCEEAVTDIDVNGDGYQDIGWVIEIDPATRTVINQDGITGADKLWAVGRQSHENVAIRADEGLIYWGADANPTGYLYKFVPNVPGDYTSGDLFVLQTTSSLGVGQWQQVDNSTQAARNNTVPTSTAAGAYNFNGIEDVEIGPDGKIYFTAKGTGYIYRFRDVGGSVDQLEIYVNSVSYDVDGSGPFTTEPWGLGHDNLAFDGEGNLWVLQDGTRNHIWVVSPAHSAASPSIRLFATTPEGSEPTGITFTPDYRYMFLSFQHPSTSNTASQQDAAGNAVVFNTHTTVVVARKEFLGPTAALPVKFSAFEVYEKNNKAVINWTVEQISNHKFFDVERSVDGIHFIRVATITDNIEHMNRASFTYTDDRLPSSTTIHYRIKQCDKDGKCSYSVTRVVRPDDINRITIYPVPAKQQLKLHYVSAETEIVSVSILTNAGLPVFTWRKKVLKGFNQIELPAGQLISGHYFLSLTTTSGRFVRGFSK
jgi:secreted PhoX family phosphatase